MVVFRFGFGFCFGCVEVVFLFLFANLKNLFVSSDTDWFAGVFCMLWCGWYADGYDGLD